MNTPKVIESWAKRSKGFVEKGRIQDKIKRIVVHITGRSLWKTARDRGIDVLDLADKVYGRGRGPHFVIDEKGRILWVRSLWIWPAAQGWGKYGGIKAVEQKPPPEWWTRAWKSNPNVHHPVDLIGDDRTPNANSIAIEFVQAEGQLCLTVPQYVAGGGFISILCHAYNIDPYPTFPGEIPNLLGHEDVDPWGRGNKGGGWDPGARRILPTFSWDALLDPVANLPEAIKRGLVWTGEKKHYGKHPDMV